MNSYGWKRLNRVKAYASKYVNVYEDTVRLPNGSVIKDYTVVEKPSIVMIVATDSTGQVLVLSEYKYGASRTLLTLPAGHKKQDEDVIAAAKRELLEETGFGEGIFDEPIRLYDYPSKDIHEFYVVRASNVRKLQEPDYENTETIICQLISVSTLKKQFSDLEWRTSSAIAAITVSGILL